MDPRIGKAESEGYGDVSDCGCTSPRHNAHGTGILDDREVFYAWHPWAGKTVRVHRVTRHPTGAIARCTAVEGEANVSAGSAIGSFVTGARRSRAAAARGARPAAPRAGWYHAADARCRNREDGRARDLSGAAGRGGVAGSATCGTCCRAGERREQSRWPRLRIEHRCHDRGGLGRERVDELHST